MQTIFKICFFFFGYISFEQIFLKLENSVLFHLKLLTLVYECINLISPTFLHNFFDNVTSVNQYNTRQACKGDIFMTHINTLQYGLRSIKYDGA